MMEIALILFGAAAGAAAAKWLRLPRVPLLVLAGLGLSASGLLTDARFLQDVLMLGLVFLVFMAGTELGPRRVGRQWRAALAVGFVQFFGLGLIGWGAAAAFGFGGVTAFYIALALAASSTLVVLEVLRQRQQFFEPFGRLVLGVLLLQDILVILGICVLGHAGEGVVGMGLAALGLGALCLLALVGARWIMPMLLRHLEHDEEPLLLTVLGVLFLFLGLAYGMGLPVVAGAFLAGVSMSGFPERGIVRGQLESLAHFFLAAFFVALGGLLIWPGLSTLLLVFVLVGLVLLVTPILVTLVAERAGLTGRASIESGLLLAQCSEFSLVVVLLGVEQGHLDEAVLGAIALVTVITMILTPFVATDRLTWWLMQRRRLARLRSRAPETEAGGGHILLLGCGPNTGVLLDLLLLHGDEVVVVDEDPRVIEGLAARGVHAIRGHGADHAVLEAAGAPAARVILSTMRRTADNERLLEFLGGARRVIVCVFGPDEARRIEAAGGEAVRYADVACEAFMAWFREQGGKRPAPPARGG